MSPFARRSVALPFNVQKASDDFLDYLAAPLEAREELCKAMAATGDPVTELGGRLLGLLNLIPERSRLEMERMIPPFVQLAKVALAANRMGIR